MDNFVFVDLTILTLLKGQDGMLSPYVESSEDLGETFILPQVTGDVETRNVLRIDCLVLRRP